MRVFFDEPIFLLLTARAMQTCKTMHGNAQNNQTRVYWKGIINKKKNTCWLLCFVAKSQTESSAKPTQTKWKKHTIQRYISRKHICM
jgi:hypothetical protein